MSGRILRTEESFFFGDLATASEVAHVPVDGHTPVCRQAAPADAGLLRATMTMTTKRT